MILKNVFFFFLLCTFTLTVFAQTTTVTRYFVDYNEKPITSNTAQHYIETYKLNDTDIYWQRKMYYNDTAKGTVASTGTSKDAAGQIKEGAFVYYYKSGAKKSAGNYTNNIKEGEWNLWNEDGKLEGVKHFRKGKMIGRNIIWHSNGAINDSIILDDNGNGKSFGFYEDGSREAEGSYTAGDKNGPWIYYYRTPKNQKSIEVRYEMDSATSYTCFTETGQVQNKDCFFEREAAFRGGNEGWRKYLIKELTDKSSVYTKYLKPGQLYTVIVKFIVNKEGNVVDIRAEAPSVAELDEIAVKIIENSPKWIPAVQYNRKVNAYRRQPISFLSSE